MTSFDAFFWWNLECVFCYELEESLIWKLENLGIKNFAIEKTPENLIEQTLSAWIPSFECSEKDRVEIEKALIGLNKAFDVKPLLFKWKKIVEEDWSSSWKRFWHPDPVGKELLILPSWLELPQIYSDRKIIRLDPGSAFGTGSHPSTRLCLEAIERNPPIGMRVGDIGCGSGILGIAALRLGAREVQAVDLDSLAIRATSENRSLNNFREIELGVSVGSVEALADQFKSKKADLLLCNILAPIIKELAPKFTFVTHAKSQLILSGLLIEQENELIDFLSTLDWKILGTYRSQKWALIHLCRDDIETNQR